MNVWLTRHNNNRKSERVRTRISLRKRRKLWGKNQDWPTEKKKNGGHEKRCGKIN